MNSLKRNGTALRLLFFFFRDLNRSRPKENLSPFVVSACVIDERGEKNKEEKEEGDEEEGKV